MGTTYRIVVTGISDTFKHASLQNDVEKTLETICQIFSTYISDSEISHFNQCDANKWFSISEDLYDVVKAAADISRKTDGAFDITIGPTVDLWGFGTEKKSKTRDVPNESEILEIKKSIGYENVELQETPPALRKLQRNVKLDASAIAKGFAVDEILALLMKRKGILGAMVEIGGEIRCFGKRHDGSNWTVGIQSPLRDRTGLAAKVSLHNESVASSGDYLNYFEHNGQKISHIMNPEKGTPVKSDVVATTVIGDSCMMCDAWATAFMVLDIQKSLDIAHRENIGLMLIRKNSESSVEVISNSKFKTYLIQ